MNPVAQAHQRGCLEVYPNDQAVSMGLAKPRTQPVPAAQSTGPLQRRRLDCGQAACSAWPRAGARGGARACRPRCVRIFSMTGASRMAAMIFNWPPQFGQCSRSRSNTRLSSRAQLSRTGPWCAQFASHVAGSAASALSSGACGTTIGRSLALGASTPWKRIRCKRGLGTRAAKRCMNSSGDITRCVVPSRQGS